MNGANFKQTNKCDEGAAILSDLPPRWRQFGFISKKMKRMKSEEKVHQDRLLQDRRIFIYRFNSKRWLPTGAPLGAAAAAAAAAAQSAVVDVVATCDPAGFLGI